MPHARKIVIQEIRQRFPNTKYHDSWKRYLSGKPFNREIAPPPKGPSRDKPLPQTKANALFLFDSIAPHVQRKDIKVLKKSLKKHLTSIREGLGLDNELNDNSKRKSRNGKKGKVQRSSVQTLLDDRNSIAEQVGKILSGAKKKSRRKKGALSETLADNHPWIGGLLAQFFAAPQAKLKSQVMPVRQNVAWQDPSFAPNINRSSFEEDIQTLMETRNLIVQNIVHTLSDKNDVLQEYIHSAHHAKSPIVLRSEAEKIATVLCDRLPSTSHAVFMNAIKDYCSDINESLIEYNSDGDLPMSKPIPTSSKKHAIETFLFRNMKDYAPFHAHLISSDLSTFFYLRAKTETEGVKKSESSKINNVLNEAEFEWNKLREEFSKTLLETQHEQLGLLKSYFNDTNDLNKDPISEEEESQRAEKMFNEFNLEEVNNSDKQKSQEEEQTTKSLKTLKLSSKINIKFDCIVLKDFNGSQHKIAKSPSVQVETKSIALDDTTTADLSTANEVEATTVDASKTLHSIPNIPSVDRTIMIDNLPIDISNEELETLYSRCGPIQSIHIFNLRPHLDPGELSKSKLMLRRRGNRLSGAAAASMQGRDRIRTPVYAMIEFQTDEGYNTATMDVLRIFGMIIRRHAVRSIPVGCNIDGVTGRNHFDSGIPTMRLYIEYLPPGLHSIDLEQRISDALHPYVELIPAVGNHNFKKAQGCLIQFPTFESAFVSYHILKDIDFGSEECTVNWMRTPSNAAQFWTRKMGVDDP